MLLLGNDVVDLSEPGMRGKWQHERFVARVFTTSEQTLIRSATHPDFLFWSLWAAKESAYKIISKLHGPPAFSHKKFALVRALSLLPEAPSPAKVTIRFESTDIPVSIVPDDDCLTALGSLDSGGIKEEFDIVSGTAKMDGELEARVSEMRRSHFSEAELASVTTAESLWVRIFCKQAIAAQLNLELPRLRIIRPVAGGKSQAPYLLVDGERCAMDVSLSHHGKWLAWCFSCQRNRRGPGV